MDSEDSREPAGEASSDGESASSSRSKGNRRNTNPHSPNSADGPESPDNDRAVSYKSDQNSDVNSPENFRPPSPDYEPKNGSESEPASPASRSYRPKRSPSSPRKSASPTFNSTNSASDQMNNPQTEENSERKWSPKSDSRSRQNSTSPERDLATNRVSRHRNRSDSSGSSRDSSPRNRSFANNPPVEEISDGEMESDHDAKSISESKDEKKISNRENSSEANVNISHEDLSDVSDLESMGPGSEDDRPLVKNSPIRAPDLSDSRESVTKPDIKLNGNNNDNKDTVKKSPSPINGHTVPETPKFEKITHDKTSKTDDVEEQLDFEAEEGECLDTPLTTKSNCVENNKNDKDDEGSGAASSLEEGEVSDDEERRPEETEPRPVCRFYSRGQCTWGVSCRFLHPGVTDKGNYTMFDMVRSMPVGYSQHPISHLHPHAPMSVPNNTMLQTARAADTPHSESAWERGLRTAKEMLRKANKRKEQDTDFEEKKMHLSLGGAGGRGASMGPGEEDDADLAAYAGFPPPTSPPPVKREREEFLRRTTYEEAGRLYTGRERSARYERIARLSVSPHRAPAFEHEKLDDKSVLGQKARRPRSTREVIVQRAPGVRADEWADPWMRGGGTGGTRSPGGRRRTRDKTSKSRGRKYSSGSSYSSSSSSRSSSRSSNSSRSGSAKKGTRRRAHSPGKPRKAVSPSVIVQERRAANARAVAMNPPAPSARKRVPSPAATRQHAANPPPPAKVKTIIDEFGRTKPVKSRQKQRKLYSKSSSSDSSSSSSDSDSESHSSSSSDSSSTRKPKVPPASRGGLDKSQTSKIPPGTRLLSPKYLTTQKKDTVENENRKETAVTKKRVGSPPSEVPPPKKPVSRREELLKQLKAVEDAIARKRSKI